MSFFHTSQKGEDQLDLPRVTSEIRELTSQRESLNLASNRHLEVAVDLAQLDEVSESFRSRMNIVEELGGIFGIDIFTSDVEMSRTHFGERPSGRFDERLQNRSKVS